MPSVTETRNHGLLGWIKWYWPLWSMCAVFITLIVVACKAGPWAWPPLIMIGFAILATQLGALYKQVALERLGDVFASREQGFRPADVPLSDEDKKKLLELRELVKATANPPNKDAQAALDSYLNQWVGTYGMVILILGIMFTLYVRQSLHLPVASWVIGVVLFIACAIGALVAAIPLFGKLLDPKSILPYYGRKNIWPPSSALTAVRVVVLVVYCFLVFAMNWPVSLKTTTADVVKGPNGAMLAKMPDGTNNTPAGLVAPGVNQQAVSPQ